MKMGPFLCSLECKALGLECTAFLQLILFLIQRPDNSKHLIKNNQSEGALIWRRSDQIHICEELWLAWE